MSHMTTTCVDTSSASGAQTAGVAHQVHGWPFLQKGLKENSLLRLSKLTESPIPWASVGKGGKRGGGREVGKRNGDPFI